MQFMLAVELDQRVDGRRCATLSRRLMLVCT